MVKSANVAAYPNEFATAVPKRQPGKSLTCVEPLAVDNGGTFKWLNLELRMRPYLGNGGGLRLKQAGLSYCRQTEFAATAEKW